VNFVTSNVSVRGEPRPDMILAKGIVQTGCRIPFD
jgi:hypothetical protein